MDSWYTNLDYEGPRFCRPSATRQITTEKVFKLAPQAAPHVHTHSASDTPFQAVAAGLWGSGREEQRNRLLRHCIAGLWLLSCALIWWWRSQWWHTRITTSVMRDIMFILCCRPFLDERDYSRHYTAVCGTIYVVLVSVQNWNELRQLRQELLQFLRHKLGCLRLAQPTKKLKYPINPPTTWFWFQRSSYHVFSSMTIASMISTWSRPWSSIILSKLAWHTISCLALFNCRVRPAFSQACICGRRKTGGQ